jgi:serine phosphatase RsbU (regulator of sigma subunit)
MLKVTFNEAVQSSSAANSNNYSVSPGAIIPSLATQDIADPLIVNLQFSDNFSADIPYSLTISDVKDLAGNNMATTQLPFAWHLAKTYDLLVSEIMADPTPSVNLPDAEYIELFNRSAYPIDLRDWTLVLGSSEKSIPQYSIPAGGYLILCDDGSKTLLEAYGPVIDFSSFTITNAGGTITLKDFANNVIHSVSYTDKWYKSNYKSEGGWSLELIDPLNPCGEADNWIASNNPSGGTPGKPNSVNATNPDLLGPSISRVGVIDPTHLIVWFSETCDSMKKDENQKLVQQKYFQYQYEKQASIDSIANSKAMEIKNIELGRQIAESKKQKIIIVFVVLGLIFIAIVAVFIFRSLRITRKQKNIIQDQKQMVDEKNFMLNQQNEEISTQRDEITAQRDLVTLQKEEIEFIHNEVSQSINYATRLQSAILPGFEIIKDFVSDHFVLYKPKDKVSGDFYWWSVVEDHLIIAVADCTGHGVPGAFMSMLGTSFLREIVVKEYMTNPGIILKRLRKEIIHTLKQKGTAGEQKDGMDMALIAINKDNLESLFAGANNPLYLLRNGELIEIKGDKMPISIHLRMEPFKNNNIKLEKGDCLYLFTDGFADQFGGPKNRKFMYKQFKDILLLNCNKPMSEQKEIIESAFDNWRGEGEQIDDVTVVGIKI